MKINKLFYLCVVCIIVLNVPFFYSQQDEIVTDYMFTIKFDKNSSHLNELQKTKLDTLIILLEKKQLLFENNLMIFPTYCLNELQIDTNIQVERGNEIVKYLKENSNLPDTSIYITQDKNEVFCSDKISTIISLHHKK
jgi:hypothetical protein